MPRAADQLKLGVSGATSSVTLGASRKRRTGSTGGSRKQSTLFHPRAASWTESSRAYISPLLIRRGLKPNTETMVSRLRGKLYVSVEEMVVRPRFSFSATVQRRSMQQPPRHQAGRFRQMSRIGVVLMLPTGGML